MGSRGFDVKIELNLLAITCPGVWLCPKGRVALKINILSTQVESCCDGSAFPLVFNEKFTFKKLFKGVGTFAELQSNFQDEFFNIELVQWGWPNSSPLVLATFEARLADLLYPAQCLKGLLLADSEVDLLMDPTKYFPGIISPKIQISIRTIIEEVIGVREKAIISSDKALNSKIVDSKCGTCVHRKKPSNGIIRQRKVCHTQNNPQLSGSIHRPIHQKYTSTVDETPSVLSSNSNDFSESQLKHCSYEPKETPSCTRYLKSRTSEESSSRNSFSHIFDNCPVCSKYKCYFSSNNDERNNIEIHDSKKFLHHYSIDRENNEKKKSAHDSSSSSSILRAKAEETLASKDPKTSCVVIDNNSCKIDYFQCQRDQDRQSFYKNLEKFYKRMYKQARIRAQQVNTT